MSKYLSTGSGAGRWGDRKRNQELGLGTGLPRLGGSSVQDNGGDCTRSELQGPTDLVSLWNAQIRTRDRRFV